MMLSDSVAACFAGMAAEDAEGVDVVEVPAGWLVIAAGCA